MHTITPKDGHKAASFIARFLNNNDIECKQSLLVEAVSQAMGFKSSNAMHDYAKSIDDEHAEQPSHTANKLSLVKSGDAREPDRDEPVNTVEFIRRSKGVFISHNNQIQAKLDTGPPDLHLPSNKHATDFTIYGNHINRHSIIVGAGGLFEAQIISSLRQYCIEEKRTLLILDSEPAPTGRQINYPGSYLHSPFKGLPAISDFEEFEKHDSLMEQANNISKHLKSRSYIHATSVTETNLVPLILGQAIGQIQLSRETAPAFVVLKNFDINKLNKHTTDLLSELFQLSRSCNIALFFLYTYHEETMPASVLYNIWHYFDYSMQPPVAYGKPVRAPVNKTRPSFVSKIIAALSTKHQ